MLVQTTEAVLRELHGHLKNDDSQAAKTLMLQHGFKATTKPIGFDRDRWDDRFGYDSRESPIGFIDGEIREERDPDGDEYEFQTIEQHAKYLEAAKCITMMNQEG